MKYLLGKVSNLFIISGLLKLTGGILVCLWPLTDFTPLIYFFAIPAIIQGLLHINAATHHKNIYDFWWVLLLIGVIYLAAGGIVLTLPDITPEFLMIVVATAWSLVGAILMLLAFQLQREYENGIGLLLPGIVSIMAGIYMVTNLHRNIYSILWVIVTYSFLIGLLTLIFGIRARAWQHIYFDDIME